MKKTTNIVADFAYIDEDNKLCLSIIDENLLGELSAAKNIRVWLDYEAAPRVKEMNEDYIKRIMTENLGSSNAQIVEMLFGDNELTKTNSTGDSVDE